MGVIKIYCRRDVALEIAAHVFEAFPPTRWEIVKRARVVGKGIVADYTETDGIVLSGERADKETFREVLSGAYGIDSYKIIR